MSAKQPLWRRLLEGWTEIAGRFGETQTLVILSLFYALLIGPTAVLARLGRSDPLDRRGYHSQGTAWLEADSSAKPDLDRVKHQF